MRIFLLILVLALSACAKENKPVPVIHSIPHQMPIVPDRSEDLIAPLLVEEELTLLDTVKDLMA